MSYLGAIRPLIASRKADGMAAVLEIGLENGYSSFSIVQNLIETQSAFGYVGIDILLKDEVSETLAGFKGLNYHEQRQGYTAVALMENPPCEKSVFLYEDNSLVWLERNAGRCKFDIIFVDGDHNYYTVARELELLKPYCEDHTLIVCDDYRGKYAEKDLYYSDREAYDDVRVATRINKNARTEKQGVKTAIDEFVARDDNPFCLEEFHNTPWCILRHKDYELLSKPAPSGLARDDTLIIQEKSTDTFESPFI